MISSPLQDLSWRYLLKMYELSDRGLNPEVDGYKLQAELGYNSAQMRSAYDYLLNKGWVSNKCRVPCVRITIQGIEEVERIMGQTYAAKEFRVLKTLRDSEHKGFNGWVNIDDLEKELPDIPYNELNTILNDLEDRKRLIGQIDQAAWIEPAGLEELDRAERYPDRETHYFPPQIINNYNVNVQGDNQGNIMQASHGSSQTSSVKNNQPISEILPKLAELIAAVRQADFPDKEEVVQELEKVQALAEGEQNEGTWKRIQSRLNVAKTSMEIVGFAYKTLPYWPLIWDYFHNR